MTVLHKIDGTGPDKSTGSTAVLQYTIDIASVAAASAADTVVTATGEVRKGDFVELLEAPATLGAVVIQGCHTVTDDAFTMRVVNGTAAAIDPASGNFKFLRTRP